MKKPSALLAASALVLILSGCSVLATPDTRSTAAPAGTTTPTEESAAGVAPKELNSSRLLGGNATPTFPAGDAGKVSVVAQSQLRKSDILDSGTLLIAYRNNTAKAISHVDFSATATAGGKIVASGHSQVAGIPAQVQPGEVALTYIYFENVSSVPDTGVTYEFQVKTSPADTSSYNTAPLKVTQADNNGTAIIGAATNSTDKTVTGPFKVQAYCFDGESLSEHVSDYATPDGELAPGGQAAFTIGLHDEACDSFVLGVSGYFD